MILIFRSEPQAYAYTPDPRDMASFLTASGVPCWLDTKRIGFGMVSLQEVKLALMLPDESTDLLK